MSPDLKLVKKNYKLEMPSVKCIYLTTAF